jgi:hypothetical protein
MFVDTSNDNNEVHIAWPRPWVVLNYDTSFANGKAGDLVQIERSRARIWINRGWARIANKEESTYAQNLNSGGERERRHKRREAKDTDEFAKLWLTEEENKCSD